MSMDLETRELLAYCHGSLLDAYMSASGDETAPEFAPIEAEMLNRGYTTREESGALVRDYDTLINTWIDPRERAAQEVVIV